jgi:signal transduction histidine kinase
VIVGVSYREWSQYHAINRAAQQTREIVETVDRIRSGVLDAETSERGFLLTGAANYLDPYRRSSESVPADLAKLEQLTANRSEARSRVAELNDIVTRKFADMAENIEDRRREHATPSVETVLGDPGKKLMDRIRRLCSGIQQRENALHSEAEADREGAAKTALLATVSGSLILLFFFVSGFQPLLGGGTPQSMAPRIWAYGAAVAVVAVATLLRMSLTPLVGESATPFITYFPAVLFAAWYGGFRAGALAILLSTITAWYFFVPIQRSFVIQNPGDLIGILLFIFVAFGIALLSDSQRRAVARRRDAENAERELRYRFERLNEELGRSNQDLQAFAFMASHDLQEPLRQVAAFSELLIRKYSANADADARTFVGNIADGVNRMQRLLSDLLSLARIGSPESEPAEPVDLNCVLENSRRNLEAAIEANEAVIVCGNLPSVCAAESHMVSLFQNLIGNAIKYRSAAAPRIEIAAVEENGELRLAVRDNGIGIPAEYHDRIFAVFQRVRGKRVPGSGLGLAICKRIVERYGGRIWVESVEGQGTTFYFTLPAAEGSDATITTGMARVNRTML